MLSREDNELLCRVGPGTPMGNLMRLYWIPAFISSELEVDGWPRRIRLLGEDLIAYRDTQGRVGVVDENCAHRGSSMIFARNEESGVRCAYHGWKYDVTGACIDMPSEAENSSFKDKVKIKAYRTQERSGIVWVYMGPRQEPPPLPDLHARLLPLPKEGVPFKYVRQCNWAQALEGDIDYTHVPYLHSGPPPLVGREVLERSISQPHLEVVYTKWGFYYGGKHDVGDDKVYCKVGGFVMPFYTSTGGKVWMPIDDYNTLIMEGIIGSGRPPGMPRDYDDLYNPRIRQPWGYKPDNLMIPWGNWRVKADVENEWFRDRSLEKGPEGVRKLWLGIYSNPMQDSAVQVTMGAIYDRTREYLGTTDKAIIAFRRIMVQAAKALRDYGEVPTTVDDPTLYRVRLAVNCVLPKDMNWIETTAPWLDVDSAGVPPEYSPEQYNPGRARVAPPPIATT